MQMVQSKPCTAAPMMLSFVDVQGIVSKCLHLLETQGDVAIDAVRVGMSLVAAVTSHNLAAIFIAINAEVKDINTIIAAIKAEFEA